jgi:hypothetical protein
MRKLVGHGEHYLHLVLRYEQLLPRATATKYNANPYFWRYQQLHLEKKFNGLTARLD